VHLKNEKAAVCIDFIQMTFHRLEDLPETNEPTLLAHLSIVFFIVSTFAAHMKDAEIQDVTKLMGISGMSRI
jgi:hypothetical protein